MRRIVYLFMACLVATMVATQGCGRGATVESTPTAVPDTERPEATATPPPTQVVPTEEPTATATPVPTEPEPSPTPTPEPQQPTTPPTATPEPTSEPSEPEGRVLLEERCTACHGLDRVEQAQKSREEWVTTVDRMVGYGAELSEAEKEVLVDYLEETYGP